MTDLPEPLQLPSVLESPAISGNPYDPIFYKYLQSVREVLVAVSTVVTAHGEVLTIQSGAADPTGTDIPDGEFRVWKNTTSGVLKLWANDGGALKSVTLT